MRLPDGSGVSREAHAPFCERLEVQFLRPTHQFHREAKQLTGIKRCQCRKARSQRNHIASAILVWVRLADIARHTGRTLYRVKHDMLDDFLRRELRNPSVPMRFT